MESRIWPCGACPGSPGGVVPLALENVAQSRVRAWNSSCVVTTQYPSSPCSCHHSGASARSAANHSQGTPSTKRSTSSRSIPASVTPAEPSRARGWLVGAVAPVDADGLAADDPGVVGQQEHHHPADLDRRDRPPEITGQ